jgi:ribosome maturation factor RimP
MSRNPLHDKLIAIIEPVCQGAGYELVDLRFVLEQGGWVLRVCVDLPLTDEVDVSEVPEDRVDLEDCENLSRELSAVLDVDDPIPQAYNLEVSSPGIERPLRTAQHFAHFAGSEAKVTMAVGLSVASPTGTSERKNFRGILRGVEGDTAKIEVDGQVFALPIADIDHAKLVPDWDAVMHGKSGAGTKTTERHDRQPNPKKKSKKSSHASN